MSNLISACFCAAANVKEQSNSNVIIDGHIGVDGTGLAFLYLLATLFGSDITFGTGAAETLTVNSSDVFFANPEGAFFFLDALYLNNSKITQPVGAYYKDGYLRVNDSEPYVGLVTILRQGVPTDINGISEAQDNAPWTTLDGRRIDKPAKAGLYLHGNKKVVVK